MTVTDPIADMLTRIRNAIMARHDFVLVPSSRIKLSIARILKEESFIKDYEVLRGKPHREIKIHLKYADDNRPIISGMLRVYVQQKEIARVYGGLGVAIVSTSKGVKTGQQAWRMGIGGELLCNVW